MAEDKKITIISISASSIIRVILVVLLALALYYIRDIILVFLVAVVIASAIEPATKNLVKRGLPRVVAVIAIYVVIIIFIVAISYLVIPSLVEDVANFMNMLPQYITTLDVKSTDTSSNLFGIQSAVQGLSKSESLGDATKNITTALATSSGSILTMLTTIFGGVLSLFLVLVLSFYLAVQKDGIEEFLRLVVPLRQEKYIIDLWQRTQHKIGRWMQGQIILAAIVGVLVFVTLTLLGVPNAFFLAIISTLFEIIPVFGPIIGAVPGVLTGFIDGGITFALLLAVVYLIIQQIESNVIYPLVMRKVLDIHPLVVIIALIVGAKLGGFLGIIISVPAAVALTEFMSDLGKNRTAARELFSTLNETP